MVNHHPLCDDTLGSTQPSNLDFMSNEWYVTTTFTVEQLKYARRYEEGYDLPVNITKLD